MSKVNKIFVGVLLFMAFVSVCFLTTAYAYPVTPYLKISLFSSMYDSQGSFLSNMTVGGHSWIQIKNESYTDSVEIAGYVLNPRDKMTIGLWGTMSDVHDGVWVNVEGKKRTIYNSAYKSNRSITSVCHHDDVYHINNFINDNNYYNLFSHNCTHFAIGLWNELFSNLNFYSNYPAQLFNRLGELNSYEYNSFTGFNKKTGYYDNSIMHYYIINK